MNNFPPDYLRYYLSIITPSSQTDVNFSWDDFQARINNELVANIGNFIHRTLTFIWKKFKGKVPKPAEEFNEIDLEFQEEIWKMEEEIAKEIERLELDNAIKKILEFSTHCNQYFQKNEPWINEKRATNCLYLCVNAVKSLAILLEPFLPFSMERLWKMLNLKGSIHEQSWDSISKLTIGPGHKIKRPKILFRKVKDEEIKKQKKKLKL